VAENNGDLFPGLIKASQPHHLSFTFMGCVRDKRKRFIVSYCICFYSKRRVKYICRVKVRTIINKDIYLWPVPSIKTYNLWLLFFFFFFCLSEKRRRIFSSA
jgi:hypothetical protein